eukprot:scaffold24.g2958.t1
MTCRQQLISNRPAWRPSPPRRWAPLLRPRAHLGEASEPRSSAAVLEWAAGEWARLARAGVPSVPKACMLLALEEEAAQQLSYRQAESLEGSEELRRVGGDASTWSLERLDALAAEAAALFYSSCQELGAADAVEAAAQGGAADAALWTLHSDLVRSYPVHALSAMNEVLFERHGYRRMARHGDPRDSQLNSVLDLGSGSPPLLGIVYREVCARLGLALHAALLDGGRYVLLWPADPGVTLAAAGERLVVDPQQGHVLCPQGNLMALSEVLELFELERLEPASNVDVMAAVLGVLRDAHWRYADAWRELGCLLQRAAEESTALRAVEEESSLLQANGPRGSGGGMHQPWEGASPGAFFSDGDLAQLRVLWEKARLLADHPPADAADSL